MFRRPRFRPLRRSVAMDAPPALRHAQILLSEGRFEEAGAAFEQLAQGAQMRGIPQDARLFLTAGHCRIQARQIDLAMHDLKQGLEIMSGRGRLFNLMKAGQQSVKELTAYGYDQEAAEIMQLLKGYMPGEVDTAPVVEQPTATGSLPPVCPSCGGTLRSDEVDWIDPSSAECSWCGATVKAD